MGLTSRHFTPGLVLQMQLNYTKCLGTLLPNVVNAQNWALKKQKLDSNPGDGPASIPLLYLNWIL